MPRSVAIPAKPDSAVTRERLIDVAERLIDRDGLDALRVRRLAEEAGVALGRANGLFGSLEGLVAAVNERTFERLLQAIGSLPEREGIAGLIDLALAYARFVRNNPRLWDATFAGDVEDLGSNPNDDKVVRLLDVLDQRSQRAGLAADQGRVLWGAVHGLVSLTVTGRSRIVGIEDVEAAVRSLVHCYATGSDPA